ncbi:MAG: dienelactone hydrolase family protein [Alphaproteobacteria bacterium]|nr:dienelactone hydrolase family protein [Alphaproteobacteria bacterium]MBN9495832.1 dienelactone hydrolase family protein [Alphaproteobacteria bacterium]
MSNIQLDGPRMGPAAGGKPRSIVALLHGLGSDGNDLISLAPIFARALPHTAFVAPNAPFKCDMAPYGWQWFSLLDRSPANILAGVQTAAPILNAFIDAELAKAELPPAKIALLGFSQGSMMSLFVAPRRAAPIAGVAGYSGRLIGGGLLADEIKSRPPVLLVHGDQDPIVPFESMAAAEKALTALNVPVETLACPGLPHSIDEAGIAKGLEFLARVLA